MSMARAVLHGIITAMTEPANITGIEKATNKSWEEWVAYLEGVGAEKLSHTEIAKRVQGKLRGHESGSWWAQSITVAYEQHIGRRKPGQDSDGYYRVAVSKTVAGTMDSAMRAWTRLVAKRRDFADVPIAKQPTTSETEKRRHWGCGLGDGSRVSVDVNDRSPGKVGVAVTHTKLDSQEAVERWRTYWKSLLNRL
jgi:hypothetical protein